MSAFATVAMERHMNIIYTMQFHSLPAPSVADFALIAAFWRSNQLQR
jgi:hypothetical protein